MFVQASLAVAWRYVLAGESSCCVDVHPRNSLFYLLLFHDNSCYAMAPQYYILLVPTLPVLLPSLKDAAHVCSHACVLLWRADTCCSNASIYFIFPTVSCYLTAIFLSCFVSVSLPVLWIPFCFFSFQIPRMNTYVYFFQVYLFPLFTAVLLLEQHLGPTLWIVYIIHICIFWRPR
jgi:hypothetical protein